MDIISWDQFLERMIIADASITHTKHFFDGLEYIVEYHTDEGIITIRACVHDIQEYLADYMQYYWDMEPPIQTEFLPDWVLNIVRADCRDWYFVEGILYYARIEKHCVTLREYFSGDYVAAWPIVGSIPACIRKLKRLYSSPAYDNARIAYSQKYKKKAA
jgi:hypothetical protein